MRRLDAKKPHDDGQTLEKQKKTYSESCEPCIDSLLLVCVLCFSFAHFTQYDARKHHGFVERQFHFRAFEGNKRVCVGRERSRAHSKGSKNAERGGRRSKEGLLLKEQINELGK